MQGNECCIEIRFLFYFNFLIYKLFFLDSEEDQ